MFEQEDAVFRPDNLQATDWSGAQEQTWRRPDFSILADPEEPEPQVEQFPFRPDDN